MTATTEEKKKVALNTRNLDPDLRKKFHILCIENGVTMQDAVVALIEEAVEKQEI